MRVEHRVHKQRVIIRDKAIQWINDGEWKALMKKMSGRHYPDLGQQGPSWSIPIGSLDGIDEWIQQYEQKLSVDCVLSSHDEPVMRDMETQTPDNEPEVDTHDKQTQTDNNEIQQQVILTHDKQTQTDRQNIPCLETRPKTEHTILPHVYKHNVPKDMLKRFSIEWLTSV